MLWTKIWQRVVDVEVIFTQCMLWTKIWKREVDVLRLDVGWGALPTRMIDLCYDIYLSISA